MTKLKVMTSTPNQAARPELKVLSRPPEPELGKLSEHYRVLESQAAIDLAGSFSVSDSPEWASGMTVLSLPTVEGGEIQATLEATDPSVPPEPVIWRSAPPEPQQGTGTLLIVEGASMGLIAAAFSLSTTVVGLLTLDSEPAEVVKSLTTLIQGQKVVILPSTSVLTDQVAYSLVKALSQELSAAGAKDTTTVIPPVGAPTLFDFVVARPDPSLVLQNLLERAKPIHKLMVTERQTLRPLATIRNGKVDLGPFVSTKLGQVVMATPERYDEEGRISNSLLERSAGFLDGRTVYATDTLLTCAPIPERVVTRVVDLIDEVQVTTWYELAVQIGPEGGADTYIHHIMVPRKDLSNPEVWMNTLGEKGAEVQTGALGTGVAGGNRIAAAVIGMVDKTTPRAVQYGRIGWVSDNGVPRYVDYEGGHGPADKTDMVRATVLPGVVIPAASEFTPDEIRRSVRETIEAARVVNPNVWVSAVAAMYLPLSGMHPEAALFYYGKPGSGKSTIMGWLQSAISPVFNATNPMHKIKNTAPTMRTEFEKNHNMFIFVDDYRPITSDQNEVADNNKVVSTLIRAGIEGGKAFTQKQERKADGEWSTRTNRATRPFVIVAGEGLPPALEVSTIERMLAIEVEKETSFTEEGKKRMNVWAGARAFTPAVAGFLRWRAKCIQGEHGGDIEQARKALQKRLEGRAEEMLMEQGIPVGRVAQVARTSLMGVGVFFEFAIEIGALKKEETEEIEREWTKIIIKAVQKHYLLNLKDANYSDQLLSAIKAALLQGSRGGVWLGPPVEPSQQSIGDITKPRDVGEPCVLLIPRMVTEIAKTIGIPPSAVDQAMKPLVVPGKNGEIRRDGRMRGVKDRYYVISPDVMHVDDYKRFYTIVL